MDQRYIFDVVADPPSVWDLGVPGTPCVGYDQLRLVPGSTCIHVSFRGGSSGASNGFRISVGDTALTGLESGQQFNVRVTNPSVGLTGFWMARSARWVGTEVNQYAQTVMADLPIVVRGVPVGRTQNAGFPAIGQTQTIELHFYPGINLIPLLPWETIESVGSVTITPANGFSVLSILPAAVPGYPFPVGEWSCDTANNQWVLVVRNAPLIADVEYAVLLSVANPNAPTAPYAWTITIAESRTGMEIASTRNVPGSAVLGRLEELTISQTSRVRNDTNIIVVTFSTLQPLYGGSSVVVLFPVGFGIQSDCPSLQFSQSGVVINGITCSVHADGSGFEVTLPTSLSVLAGESISIQVSIRNPVTPTATPAAPPQWTVTTFGPDSTPVDTARLDSFPIFESDLGYFNVTPSSRLAGIGAVSIQFTPASNVAALSLLWIRAPTGVVWRDTNSVTVSEGISSTGITTVGNLLKLAIGPVPLIGGNLYTISARVLVPLVTPTVNDWWIESYNASAYAAASTAVGFATQMLTEVSITPYDTVSESWQNFILIQFRTTANASNGIIVTGPTGLRFVCPIKPYRGPVLDGILSSAEARLPLSLPGADCTSNDNSLTLSLVGAATLRASHLYEFLVSVVNPAAFSRDNGFRVSTLDSSGMEVEIGSGDGFGLTTQMVGSGYLSVFGVEDRRVGQSAAILLTIGFPLNVTVGSTLSINAPIGYTLCITGKCGVNQVLTGASQFALLNSNHLTCACGLTDNSVSFAFIADVRGPSIHAIVVRAVNPYTTPLWNYWRMSVSDPAGVVTQTDAWIQGYAIQEVLAVQLRSYNQARAIRGQISLNLIECVFQLSTSVPVTSNDGSGGSIRIVAPEGFVMTTSACSGLERSNGWFPRTTTCAGDGNRTLLIRIPDGASLQSGVSYSVWFRVNNPSTTRKDADAWSISTLSGSGSLIDLAVNVSGFQIYERLPYFSVTPVAVGGGLQSAVLITFQLSADLQPRSNITISAPGGASGFSISARGSTCVAAHPGSVFPSGSKQGLPLPSFMQCYIQGNSTIVLSNSDISGGILRASATYTFAVGGVLNPSTTPVVNLWRIAAQTDSTTSLEVWTITGFPIRPQLRDVAVTSSNPAFGQWTVFTVALTSVSGIDSGGAIDVLAPSQGYSFVQRANDSVCEVSLGNPSDWRVNCPLDIAACAVDSNSALCAQYTSACTSGALNESRSPLMICSSVPGRLTIQIGYGVSVPAGTFLSLKIAGYNTIERLSAVDNFWIVQTRTSSSNPIPLDQSTLVSPFQLVGTIHVLPLVPSSTKVLSSNNNVHLQFSLQAPIAAPAAIDISFPVAFSQGTGLSLDVTIGDMFPVTTSWAVIDPTTVRITFQHEGLASNQSLSVWVVVSNPASSPTENTWEITAYSASTIVDINTNIPGFDVFALFEYTAVAGRVLGPLQVNTVGIGFSLASDLARDSMNPSSYLDIVFPHGYSLADSACGVGIYSTSYARSADADSQLDTSVSFSQIPSASLCRSTYDTEGRVLARIELDAALTFGVMYAFQVGVVNPPSGASGSNTFVFRTSLDGLLLHLADSVPGMPTMELEGARILAAVPTRSVLVNPVRVSFVSRKNLPERTSVRITAPIGFSFTCTDLVVTGLPSTTTCRTSAHVITLTTPNGLIVPTERLIECTITARNPERNPNPNLWKFEIIAFSGTTLDVKYNLPGFDIAGPVTGAVSGQFVYTNHKTPIWIRFSPATVHTRAESGNVIIITAPAGFMFPVDCGDVYLIRDGANSGIQGSASGGFESPKFSCVGYSNETAIITFVRGYGIRKANYTLRMNVLNPSSVGASVLWTIETRGNNLITGTSHTLDYNSTLPGYSLVDETTIAPR